jgi:hypothetical protein
LSSCVSPLALNLSAVHFLFCSNNQRNVWTFPSARILQTHCNCAWWIRPRNWTS